jgi:phosphomannomutase
MSLMVSISGIRGIVGSSLTPDVVVRYAGAFAEFCRRRNPDHTSVVIGRDGRVTGRVLTDLISSTLLAAGIDVRDLGICPTPTVQLATEKELAAGGISVTASHNPMQWNGLKFVAPTGMFLDADENKELWSLAEKPATYAAWNAVGTRTDDSSWLRKHCDAVLALPYIQSEAIRKRHFTVVLDCVNAAGGAIVPALLERLGCTVIPMNCEVSGVFAHAPEPIPENLVELAGRVRAEHADLGIAVDPDVDRLVLITEKGEPYSEEYTIASVVRFILGHTQKDSSHDARVVVNLSTTRAVEDIARHYGAETIRTPVGEINVAKKMKEIGAIIGGEGSGGVILPALHLGRDAIVGIGLVLQLLAETGGTLSALKASLPQYSIAKGRLDLGTHSPDAMLARIQSHHGRDGRITTDDGLKIDFPTYWVHLRKSNTEPIIRIIAEAPTMAKADEVVDEFKNEIQTYMAQ